MTKGKENKLLETEMTASDNAFAQNKMLKVILTVIGIIGTAIYFQLADLKDSYRAVIHFPGTEETAEITGNKASERYLMMAAEFVTGVYMGATPATVDREYSALLMLVHPSRYGAMQERLAKEAKQLKQLQTVSVYGDVDWGSGFRQVADTSGQYGSLAHVNTLTFNVARSIFVGSDSEQERRTVSMDYVIENGRFWLLDIRVEKNLETI